MIVEGFPDLGVCFVWRGMLRDCTNSAASLSIHPTLPLIASCRCRRDLTSLVTVWFGSPLIPVVILCPSFTSD